MPRFYLSFVAILLMRRIAQLREAFVSPSAALIGRFEQRPSHAYGRCIAMFQETVARSSLPWVACCDARK
jgi:hypothetical protein